MIPAELLNLLFELARIANVEKVAVNVFFRLMRAFEPQIVTKRAVYAARLDRRVTGKGGYHGYDPPIEPRPSRSFLRVHNRSRAGHALSIPQRDFSEDSRSRL